MPHSSCDVHRASSTSSNPVGRQLSTGLGQVPHPERDLEFLDAGGISHVEDVVGIATRIDGPEVLHSGAGVRKDAVGVQQLNQPKVWTTVIPGVVNLDAYDLDCQYRSAQRSSADVRELEDLPYPTRGATVNRYRPGRSALRDGPLRCIGCGGVGRSAVRRLARQRR